MFPAKLTVPKLEINFDTPNRDRFLQDEFPQRSSYTVLGRGSYGVVIKARYKGKSVAVKILEKHSKHQCRFDSLKNEANILNLRHENIVRVLKIISGAQYGLVIMERFDGHCLQNILNQNYVIAAYHRLLILCDIINGLCFCHRHHIVHLDVKPQNVIVCLLVPGGTLADKQCPYMRKYMCKLCDFGSSLAQNVSTSAGTKTTNRGTIRYMAPELLRGVGGITETADIYSFGITMWQLNEGKDPYDSIVSNEAVAYNVVKKKLRPDSVTTVTILRSEPLAIPAVKYNTHLQPPAAQVPFRARKNSDNSLEIAQTHFRTSSQRSFHSSILMSSCSSGQQQPNVECAAEAMSDVLKQQGIDLMAHRERDSAIGELTSTMLNAIFAQRFELESADQNGIRQEYRSLYRKCWQNEANLRPAASDVRASLHGMLEGFVCCK